jgi:hypothetical protein
MAAHWDEWERAYKGGGSKGWAACRFCKCGSGSGSGTGSGSGSRRSADQQSKEPPEDVALLKHLIEGCDGDLNKAREFITLDWRFSGKQPDVKDERQGKIAINTLRSAMSRKKAAADKGKYLRNQSNIAHFFVLLIGFLVPTITGLNAQTWFQSWPMVSQLLVIGLSILSTVLTQLERTFTWKERAELNLDFANREPPQPSSSERAKQKTKRIV